MTDFKKDMARIQTLVGDAFSATGGLVALSDGGVRIVTLYFIVFIILIIILMKIFCRSL